MENIITQLPSIIALILGLGSMWVSYQTVRSNERNTRTTTSNNKDLALMQLKNAKEQSLLEHNTTLTKEWTVQLKQGIIIFLQIADEYQLAYNDKSDEGMKNRRKILNQLSKARWENTLLLDFQITEHQVIGKMMLKLIDAQTGELDLDVGEYQEIINTLLTQSQIVVNKELHKINNYKLS